MGAREVHPVTFFDKGDTIPGIRDFRPRPQRLVTQPAEDETAAVVVVEPVQMDSDLAVPGARKAVARD